MELMGTAAIAQTVELAAVQFMVTELPPVAPLTLVAARVLDAQAFHCWLWFAPGDKV
jgi:hypothetical protein